MSGVTRNKLGAVTLALIVLAFVVAAIATNVWLRGARIDLTENNLYTLGEGTQAVLDGIDEPINLYLFFSNEATETLPTLRAYATRVREMLEELAANAPDGKLVLNLVDPLPFSEEEDRAEQLGLQAVDVGTGGDPIYFGLAGTNSVGTTDRIPFFQPDPRKEAFLEYDLARLIYNLANTDKTVVGLLTSAPISGGFDPQTQQPRSRGSSSSKRSSCSTCGRCRRASSRSMTTSTCSGSCIRRCSTTRRSTPSISSSCAAAAR